MVLDGRMRVVTASRSFYRRFQGVPGETEGRSLFALDKGRWDIPALRELLETILPRDQVFEGFSVEYVAPSGGRCKLLLNGRRIVGAAGDTPLILLAMEEEVLD